MKKLLLAFVALAFAFAISSCCDQSYCPGNMKCRKSGDQGSYREQRRSQVMPRDSRKGESFHEYDKEDQQMEPGQQQERNSRRW
jgi:hypothetical protein